MKLVTLPQLALLALSLALTLACPDAQARPPSSPSSSPSSTAGTRGAPAFYLGGIQVNEDDHARWVEQLKASGMNTVAVTVYAKQGDWDTSNLWHEDAPAVIAEMRTARAAGLHVVLVLRVALDHAFKRNEFLWHGMIMPRTDDDVREWFRRYRAFVGKWSAIAEAEGVDVLAIASELNSLTSTAPVQEMPALYAWWLDDEKQAKQRELALALGAGKHQAAERMIADQRAHREWAEAIGCGGDLACINARRALLEREWLRVIETARASFKRGQLSYAANFDQYQEVRFWSQLDVIGINAYFKLRSGAVDAPPDDAEMLRALERGWRGIIDEIVAFERQRGLSGKQVIFTELGYTRRRGSTLEPWSAGGFSVMETATAATPSARLVVWQEEPESLTERALAVRALRQALDASASPGLLRGALYWKLSTKPEHRAIEPFVLVIGSEERDPLLPALVELARTRR